jgi:hypothetical protein
MFHRDIVPGLATVPLREIARAAGCSKAAARASDWLALNAVGAVRCAWCGAVRYGDLAGPCPACHELGIVVEMEAGRRARGNAVYRDLVRTSLIVGARFLVLGVMQEYRHLSGGRPVSVSSYRDAKEQLDAIYASGRLVLPFGGLLPFGC